MRNNFDENLKKALTEYEKEIVEQAEKSSKKSDFVVVKRSWIKYSVGIAAVLMLFIPSSYLGKSFLETDELAPPSYSENKNDSPFENDDTIKSTEENSITIANLSIETLTFDNTITNTKNILSDYKGDLEYDDFNVVNNFGNNSGYLSYKIPAENFEDILDKLENLDIKIIGDNDLSLADSKDSITLNLEILEVKKYSSTNSEDLGFSEKVIQSFKDFGTNFIDFLKNGAVGFIMLLPFILVITLITVIIKKFKRKN